MIGLSLWGILFLVSLTGCAVGGSNWMLGMGSIEKEWYPDGKPKSTKIESKTPIEDAVSISGIKE